MLGNSLGTFLETDVSFLDTSICCLGKVLVLLDLCNGLAADIVIQKGDFVFTQPLDYVGFPFRCNRCHYYGHILEHCLLPFEKKQTNRLPMTKFHNLLILFPNARIIF